MRQGIDRHYIIYRGAKAGFPSHSLNGITESKRSKIKYYAMNIYVNTVTITWTNFLLHVKGGLKALKWYQWCKANKMQMTRDSPVTLKNVDRFWSLARNMLLLGKMSKKISKILHFFKIIFVIVKKMIKNCDECQLFFNSEERQYMAFHPPCNLTIFNAKCFFFFYIFQWKILLL